ncbi:tripartite ATP-independent transporter DctP family solute receptor [Bradyrhizobium sp. LM2.7]
MRKLLLAVAAAAILVAPAVAEAQSPIIIKFSHVVANDTPKGKGALKFKELAEKYTDGKVKIEVYPNSTLYKDKEEIEALQLGSVHMLAPSTAKFAPLGIKEFEALDLPWLFKDGDTYANAMKGTVGKWLFQKLEAKGITGLGYWDNGFHMVSANRPLVKPTDFQGLKFRISGSKVADQYFRLVGTIPQIMAFSEVYQALQTGVVDGLREHGVELLDAEILRSAEGHHRVLSRASPIRRHRELEILVRPAARYSHPAREGDDRGDRLYQLDCAPGERGRARRDQEGGQDHAALSYRRRSQGLAGGDAADVQMGQGPGRAGGARSSRQGTRRQDELTAAPYNNNPNGRGSRAPGRFALE